MVAVLEGRHGALGGRCGRVLLHAAQPQGRCRSQLGLGRRGRNGTAPGGGAPGGASAPRNASAEGSPVRGRRASTEPELAAGISLATPRRWASSGAPADVCRGESERRAPSATPSPRSACASPAPAFSTSRRSPGALDGRATSTASTSSSGPGCWCSAGVSHAGPSDRDDPAGAGIPRARRARRCCAGSCSAAAWPCSLPARPSLASATACCSGLLGDRLDSHYVLPIFLALACVPLCALSDVQDGIGRGRGWMAVGLLPPYVLRPLLLLGCMTAAHFCGLPTNASTAAGCGGACDLGGGARADAAGRRAGSAARLPKERRSYDFRTLVQGGAAAAGHLGLRSGAAEHRCADRSRPT